MWYPIRRLIVGLLLAVVAAAAAPATAAQGLTGAHALSMFDDVRYGPGFEHFDYADPNAPTGGGIRLAALGTFDSLNPFILKGNPAAGSGLIYDSLLTGSLDEPFTEYGLLVESIDMAADRSWVAFTLREEARWHDGRPVTVDDVIWTTETLTTKGHPFYRHYYADISSVSQTGPRTVRFDFGDTVNRELALIVGQIEILPKHYWEGRDFESTTLDPPLGSGAYRIAAVEPGRSITLERVPDYWGRDLAVNRGQNNIDVIRYDYYRDATVAVEAFKAGEFDFRSENNSKEWGTAYDIPDVENGRMIKELIDHERPTGMQAFWFNTRRAKFADRRVRHALAHTFDFEWSNANLFYGQYTRTGSFFSNTELASSGLPQGQELEILERYRDRIPAEMFTSVYEPPSTDGSGNIRRNLRIARKMLEEAGWGVRDGTLIHAETGEAMEIEFLLVAPAFERIVGPVVQNMKRLGIVARIRIVDPAQYQNRVNEFDFRHRHIDPRAVPEPGQRAAQPLDHGLGRRSRQWEPRRRQGPGRRRIGRPPDSGAGSRHPRGDHPRTGPRAAVGPLRDPAVAHSQLQARLLEQVRPARDPAEIRSRVPGDLVDRPGEGRPARNLALIAASTGSADPHACLYRPPACADHPDPVRDHGDQFHRDSGGPGGTD